MFRPVSSQVHFPSLEEGWLQFWREKEVFRRTWEERPQAPLYVFYEGPPTANGLPHIGHVLTRVFKDVVLRYWTMKGYRVLRRGGWDTHGLPVELEVEKELGLSSKADIEAYGIDRFNQRCRESVMRYVKEWEQMTERIGFWLDMKNAYITYDNRYIETCWHILRRFWEDGLIYPALKSAPHCPRCVTTLSSHEVALGYQENTPDPSVWVKFPVARAPESLRPFLEEGVPLFVLAWTTTPWTLPGNTALAVHPDEYYALVEQERGGRRERYLLAAALLDASLEGPYTVLTTIKGEGLRGLRYVPLYDPFTYGTNAFSFDEPGREDSLLRLNQYGSLEHYPRPRWDGTFPLITGEFVSMKEGTGVVHVAPAFGEEDFEAGKREGLFFIQHVDLQGRLLGRFPFANRFVKEADPDIIRDLRERGLLYREGVYSHTYPFCWRCETPLLYYAKRSWYIRTTARKERLVALNREINWYPEHIKEGRFGEWLRNNVDWALSRERYWGTPLPLWAHTRPEDWAKHGETGWKSNYVCIGSIEDLRRWATPESRALLDSPALDLHRPFIDRITIQCPTCGGEMERVPEVLDCWFDSGAMPFAQVHYPFDAPTLLEDGPFPADYICEAVDQTRGWFYSLHAISTLLTDRPCYKNVICLGLVLDEKGEKMSKSRGNVVDPGEVIKAHGADALRWYLFTAAPPGNDRRFSLGLVEESVRRFLLILWNIYTFFVTYARLDRFDPRTAPRVEPASDLDRWALSELNSLMEEVDRLMADYDPTTAGRRMEEFVDLLSTWYVRRSRRRFWKSENDRDKLSAHWTLYTCLVTLSRLLAPFTPFLAEEMYQNLVRGVDPTAPDSVHLTEFPRPDRSRVDPEVGRATRLALRVISLARSARQRARLKVRQPLPLLLVKTRTRDEEPLLRRLLDQVREEVNVKEVRLLEDEGEVVDYQVRPRRDLLGAKYGPRLPLVEGALASADPRFVAGRARAGFPIPVGEFTLEPGEVEVTPVARPGFSIASEAGYLVAVSTEVTPDLAREGLAREVVHRLQLLRRSAGFEVADRIAVYYQGPEMLREVMERFAPYIQAETLALRLVEGPPPEGAYAQRQRIDGMEALLGVQRVEGP